MIKTMLYNQKTGGIRWGDMTLFSEWKNNPELWIWADFDNEDKAYESELFRNTFGLHPLAICDAQRDRHPPKLEAFDDYFLLLIAGLDKTAKDIDFGTLPIALFIGQRFLVTRRKLEYVSIDKVWNEIKNSNHNPSQGPAHIAYLILRQATDRYTTIVEGLESRIDDMEDEMFEHPRDALLEELLGYSRTLKRLRRIFEYHQHIFLRLSRKDNAFVGIEELHEFNDVFEHTERLTNLTSLYKELTDDLMNSYISVTSHRLNQIMKVLTIVTVIFLPLTLMVGIYGMNFENIPELKMKNAYFVLLTIMSSLVVTLLAVFRKMRWL